MDQVQKTLLSRRSIRKYKTQQISKEQLQAVLTAGLYAPSAMNEQAWKLVAIQDPKELQKVTQAAMKLTGRTDSPFYNAPTLVIVFVKQDAIAPFSDGALSIGNMMNQAYALGLGSCWIHCVIDLFSTPEGKSMQKRWGISDEYISVGSCILGIPDEDPPAKPRVPGTTIIL